MPSPSQISVDLPIEVLGGLVTQFDPQKLPMGASPFNQDCSFYTSGGVKTRPGVLSVYPAPFPGNPSINYVRTFVDLAENFRQMNLDSLGNVRQEFPPTVVSIIGGVTPGSFIQSDTYAGKEWMAVGDGAYGLDIPRHWDGTYFDRVSQVGPGAAPVVNDFLPAPATIGTAGGGLTATIIATANGEQAVGPIGSNPFPPPKFVTNNVLVTTTTPHGFLVGQIVTLTGDAVGGTQLISAVPSPTTFKFQTTLPNGGSVPVNLGGGGTAAVGPPPSTTAQRSNNVVTVQTTAPHGFSVGWPVQISGLPTIATGGATTATAVGGVVTATTATPHGLVVGTQVIIAGMSDTSFNGTYIVQSVPSATKFTYSQNTTTNGATGGTTSCTFDGTFTITGIPTPTSFTYTQLGPNQVSTSAGLATIVGNISPGLHQVSVCFLLRSGYITCPAIPNSFIAGGGKFAAVSQIATGPQQVVARILIFTPAITPPATAGPFFYNAATMQINDNTSTSATVNFLDAVLESGTPATSLFNLIELGECSGVVVYAERTFWVGERNKVNAAGGGGGFNNLTFDGGFGVDGSGNNFPLGWTEDPVNYAGGNSANALGFAPYYGDAYMITGDGVTAIRGMISQTAAVDYLQVPILMTNTQYGVRFRAAAINNPISGNLVVEVFSPTIGSMGVASFAASTLTQTYVEFILPLIASFPSIPADAVLRVYSNATLSAGAIILIDCIEVFPTLQPINRTIVRCSFAEDPESFDVETGLMIVGLNNGQSVRSMFWLLDNKLYLTKERSLYGTNDDGQNEPDLWTISTISQTVGTPSINGTSGKGETWGVIASHDGCYIFDGTTPKKIAQEIQPTWDAINWGFGTEIYTVIDTTKRRIHIGAPVTIGTPHTVEFVLDYGHLTTAQDIVDHPQAYYSAYQPTKIIAPGRARKWTLWYLFQGLGAASAAMTVQADGSYHLLRGNAAGNGKIYDQSDTAFSDDGVAINFQYETYFLPETEQEEALQLGSHRKLLKYLTGYAWGSGIMFFTVTGPQGQRQKSLSSLVLQNPAHWDFEMNSNWTGERCSLIFGVIGQVGGWGALTKFCPTLQRELITPIRGVA